MSVCFFAIAVFFFLIGVVQLFAPEPPIPAGEDRPRTARFPAVPPRRPQIIPPSAAPAQPVSVLSPSEPGGGSVNPQRFGDIQVGDRIRVRHPNQGELTLFVIGRILYQELWQQTRSPQSPWVPTGNNFLGFWLENNLFLLNWQSRLYLLEERVPLSDADIQRDFASHARKFAQSDQTADVYFAYPPASWHMDDIGKFRVQSTEGEGLVFRPGATGRFIHASGDNQRALVVEDYEGGGGGQDSAWIGVLVDEAGVSKT